MDIVRIFDTTLRDGEQSPGFSMNREEKLRMAHQLEDLGVDVIEAGFPIASKGDREGVRAVAAEIRGCRVAALCRARQEDVDAALDSLGPAASPRLHIFLATSDLHLKHKLRVTREEALEQIARMVEYGRERCGEVEFSAEDASRTDMDYLAEVLTAALAAGATILNLPDTVGYSCLLYTSDPRFAIAFVGSSGAGGAKILRRNFGEQVENIASTSEYHWMAGNFLKYAGPLTVNDLPVDAHELIALCAPRPVFISSGSQSVERGWVDAKGMFRGCLLYTSRCV